MNNQEERGAFSQFLLVVLMFLSGMAGLGYEIVWTRMFASGLGHEVPSMLAVVAAFFGGLALGAWALDRVVSRSLVPGRWYAALEAVIGIWAGLTMVLVPWANTLVAHLTGASPSPLRHWVVAFCVPFVVLLPATAAMGATLPTMDRLFCKWRSDGRSLAGLYASNTLGAVFGVMAATFFCVPWLGYRASLMVFAVLNIACALIVATRYSHAFTRGDESPGQASDSAPKLRLGVALLITGLLGVGYEVLGVRVMAQVLENTVYSFASALAVYLLGTAAGAAAYQALAKGFPFQRLLSYLLVALCNCCLFGVLVLFMSRWVHRLFVGLFGQSLAGAVAAEMSLALLVFGPATCLMGATFCHLAQAARAPSGGVGRALALNTLGGSLASPIFAVLLLPVLGAKWALVLLATAYLMLMPRLNRAIVFAVAPMILLVMPVDLVLVQPIGRGEMLTYREGVMAAVAVVTDDHGDRHLKINDRFRMGGTRSQFGERRQAHIPLLLHPAPQSALFLGLGTGITFASAADHSDLTAEAVELIPEVVDVLPYFQQVTGDLSATGSLSLHVADARRYIKTTANRYDVIVADLFHPARDGAGTLYTREHFAAVQQRLNPGGLFCQWLPLYQMDLETLRIIVSTFQTVFPDAQAYLLHFNVDTPAIGLIGTTNELVFSTEWYDQRIGDDPLSEALYQVGLPDGLAVFGCQLALPEQLRTFAQDAAINTDNLPLVNFVAPRFAYEKRRPAHRALIELLDQFQPRSDKLVDAAAHGETSLLDYLAARDFYLRAEVQRVLGHETEALDGYVASARQCSDFRIGYTMAVNIARQQATAGDLTFARQILVQLIDAAPSRPEAQQLLGLIQPQP